MLGMGVYKIVNLHSGKVYVGSSHSVHARWLTHRSQLNNGLHGNPELQSDWSSLGPDGFSFRMLEEVSDASTLIAREQSWMNELTACATGYNRKPIAAPGGAKQSAEMREALRLVMSGLTGREAARQAGVREESLYRRVEYREWRKAQNEKIRSAKGVSL